MQWSLKPVYSTTTGAPGTTSTTTTITTSAPASTTTTTTPNGATANATSTTATPTTTTTVPPTPPTTTATTTARRLRIMRTNDVSMSNTAIISAANAAAASAAFDYAAGLIMAAFSDPITVNIRLAAKAGTSTLGQSSTPIFGVYTYASLRPYFASDAKTADDATALAHNFPPTTGTPPTSPDRHFIPRALCKALGVIPTDSVNDGTVTFGAGHSYTFDPANRAVSGKMDFIGMMIHEITEVMGRIPGLGSNFFGAFLPFDLFRYTANNVRGLTNGNSIYYSIDNGATNLKNFYFPNGDGSDPQDWANGTSDTFNARSSSGVQMDFTAVDKQVMDVIGYDRIAGQMLPLAGLLTAAQVVPLQDTVAPVVTSIVSKLHLSQ